MIKLLNLIAIISIAFTVSCSEKEAKKERSFILKGKAETESTVEAKNQNTLASKKIDLKNKGIGPIKSIQFKAEIDQTMVTHGAELYKKKCTSCHRPDKKFIGPAIILKKTLFYLMGKLHP
jgi:mono/diheme cytochrome c family protein